MGLVWPSASLLALRLLLLHEQGPDLSTAFSGAFWLLLSLLLLAFSEDQRKRMVEESFELRKKEVLGNCLSHTYREAVRKPALLLLSSLEAALFPPCADSWLLLLHSGFPSAPSLPLFVSERWRKGVFPGKVRATVQPCRLLILVTSSRVNHCLQDVKTYVKKTKLLEPAPQKNLARL